MSNNKLNQVTPGEILREDFMSSSSLSTQADLPPTGLTVLVLRPYKRW